MPKKKAKGKAPSKAKKATKAPRQNRTSKKPAKGVNSVDRVAVFAREYVIDLNGRQAAIRAGYSPQSARTTASELLAKPEVQEAIQKAMDERSKRTDITADMVLERFWAIATADPRELIELQRGCCRYCWGTNNRFQRTPREMEESRQKFEADKLAGMSLKGSLANHWAKAMFDEAGGLGWDPRRDPNEKCPECFGEGTERVVPKDTRDLSPDARMLYAGVKTTQNGLEIKMHDQTGMLTNVAKHLGMMQQRVAIGGDPKNPTPVPVQQFIDEVCGADVGIGPANSRADK